MRVLHVINSLSGSGGAEQGMVREIVRFEPSVEQMMVRLYQPDQLEPQLVEAGVVSRCLGLESGNSGWNWPAGARRLGSHIRDFQPDIIHSSLASANLISQIAAERAGLPVLSTFTLSGDPALMRRYQPGAAKLRAQVLRRIERVWARRSHVWFRALTTDAKETNSQVAGLDPDRVEVIPRGVPMPDETASPPSRSYLGLPDDRPLILNVGRQTAQKGHADLVEAFAGVLARVPAHLVILGREGDGTEALQTAITAFGVGEHVSIVPYNERPYDFYRSADVFAFPSLMEGLGTAVLEAMACGLPVVAYDIPPVNEVTGRGERATLVPVGAVSQLSEAVAAVLVEPGPASATARAAREEIRAGYSLDGVAKRLESHLMDVCNLAAETPPGR